jgi:predicted Rdx family selenoprotein
MLLALELQLDLYCWYCNWCGRNAKLLLEKASSTEVGNYSISNLPAGTYTVTVDNCLF